MNKIYKYPRTEHIVGSKLQPGDEDLSQIPFSKIKGKHLVIEEKMDGANSAISFSPYQELLLQSRGHYLTGGPREKHFDLFKAWANSHNWELKDLLGDRYIMYGEWMYAKHTVFYNDLPNYFMEFDILDVTTKKFLSTEKRMEILKPFPFISSVKVLHEGHVNSVEELRTLVGPSHFIKGDHISELSKKSESLGFDAEKIVQETDNSNLMEGLYDGA